MNGGEQTFTSDDCILGFTIQDGTEEYGPDDIDNTILFSTSG